MLANAIAIANGKGGCGKTSLAANLAGYAALSGWKVLLVELDPQGNLGLDLGRQDDWKKDGGRLLYDAVVRREPIEPLRNVRPHVDAIPAGPETAAAAGSVLTRDEQALGRALTDLATGYNLVLLDCPPDTAGPLVRSALAAARYLLIPTVRDLASIEGLERMAEEFARTRSTTNRQLQLLGVALIAFDLRSVVLREVRQGLARALDGTGGTVFDTVIRANANAAEHARLKGELLYEYEAQARAAAASRFTLLREGRKERSHSKSAEGLAEDYQRISTEILARFADRRQQGSAA